MNRRQLLMGVAATPIAWAWQQYAGTHTPASWSFSAFVKRPVAGTLSGDLVTGHWYHMVWQGDQFFLDGVLASPSDRKWLEDVRWIYDRDWFHMDMEIKPP